MAVAALLHPEVGDPEHLAEALRPEEVRAPLVHGDDVLVVDLREHPLLLAPDRRAVGPLAGLVAVVEEPHPGHGAPVAKRLDVVADLEQVPAAAAVVDDLA